MTTELVRTLEAIAPTDDQALEDRALACFVVACGELALMQNSTHRDTVVGQLTVVGRRLVEAGAAAVESNLVKAAATTALEGKAVEADAPAAEGKLTKGDMPAAKGRLFNAGATAPEGKLIKADASAAQAAATEDRKDAKSEIAQREVAAHMGMTWDQLEAVLKEEKAARETSVKLSHTFP